MQSHPEPQQSHNTAPNPTNPNNHNTSSHHGTTATDSNATPDRKWTAKKKGPSVVQGEGAGGVKTASKEGFGSTPIHRLPTESLSHVFAHLPPASLAVAQLVCHDWHDVIEDEASWRNAFETYYGILSDGQVALGRRLVPTNWRSEYITRVALLSRWSRSRTSSLTHSPNIGPLSTIHINLRPGPLPSPASSSPSPPALLSISLSTGQAITSSPFTGRVSKSSYAATPLDNLGEPLYPHLPLLPVTSFALAPDGTKIIWGMADGSFRIGRTAEPVGTTARAWAGTEASVRAMAGHGIGAKVEALAFGTGGGVRRAQGGWRMREELFASVGKDGGVAIWSLLPPPVAVALSDGAAPSTTAPSLVRPRDQPVGRRVWEASLPLSPPSIARGGGAQTRACAIAFDSGSTGRNGRTASVVVGRTDGSVHVWTGINFDGAGAGGPNAGERGWRLEDVEGESGAVDTLFLDPSGGREGTLQLLVHRKDSTVFHRYTFPPTLPSSLPPTRTTFGHKPDHLGALTAFACNFDEPGHAPSSVATDKLVTGFEPFARAEPNLSSLVASTSSASIDSLAETSPLGVDDLGASTGAGAFGRGKYVVAGDAQGRVFVWDWEAEECAGTVEPRRMIQGFESRVTALEITEAAVFVGGLDGTLRCYDTLTSTLLRTFKDRAAARLPARMLAAGLVDASEEDRWKVSTVRADRQSVVAAIGGRILAWQIAGEVKKRKSRAGGKMSARTERVRSEYELRQEVRESMSALSTESTSRIARLDQEQHLVNEYGLPPSLHNMTEDEAVAFAMMLSVDDQEARWFSDSGRSSTRGSPAFEPVPEELLEMDGLSLDGGPLDSPSHRSFGNLPSSSTRAQPSNGDDSGSEDEEYEEDERRPSTSHDGSYSRSLSIPSSPYLRGTSVGPSSPSPARSMSQTWRPASQHSSPSLSVYHPHSYSSTASHTKVQLSPRLGPTYGAQAIPSGPVPSMSEELWPVARSSASPPSVPSAPSTSTPSPKPAFQGTQVRRGWNEVARSASGSPSPSPRPVSSAGGGEPRSSLLTARLREEALASGVASPRAAEDLSRREEEELRFAIELSLAEEASRSGR